MRFRQVVAHSLKCSSWFRVRHKAEVAIAMQQSPAIAATASVGAVSLENAIERSLKSKQYPVTPFGTSVAINC
jgi:hypothetical protein